MPGQQQGIVEDVPRFRELDADGRLRIMQPLGRARDVLLGQQHVERDEQIEIQTSEAVIHVNTYDFRNSFLI